MTKLRVRFGRFEAPVDYGEIFPWLQRVRVGAALTILAAATVVGYMRVPGALFPMALAAIVAIHAGVRITKSHSPTEVLVVDAIAIAIGLGVTAQTHAPLIAAAAYLIAAAITFGGLPSLFWALSSFAISLVIRPHLPIPDLDTLSGASKAALWITVAVFLSAVALSLMVAASEMYNAKKAQTAALAAERGASEMKNQFVSMVSHELRTPLTNISGFAETLHDTWQELPGIDVDEFLAIIVSESEHLKDLVEDVLAIPRLEAGRMLLDPTDFPLRPAAFKIVDLLIPDGGERSASVSIGSNVVVHADPNRVEQVLRNLIDNARKYGGQSISVDAVPFGNDWQIVVADTGTGLSPEDRERVFKAFEQVTSGDTRTETGFGLGLAVAAHLVDAMGGRIWYEPGFPVGARFCFTLPIGIQQEGSVTAVA
jgi:signal transduction histidine kinase